jgi:hypothetical protein
LFLFVPGGREPVLEIILLLPGACCSSFQTIGVDIEIKFGDIGQAGQDVGAGVLVADAD